MWGNGNPGILIKSRTQFNSALAYSLPTTKDKPLALEDTLRVADIFPMQGRAPDNYSTPYPPGSPNWNWLDLWEQENPRPTAKDAREDWEYWYSLYKALKDRIWVAWSFPQFDVFDWTEEDVQIARKLISRHVCSVCGRSDDAGCWMGC